MIVFCENFEQKRYRMQLKTILNRVQKFQSFVYTDVKWTDYKEQVAIEVTIEPRKNSQPIFETSGKSNR